MYRLLLKEFDYCKTCKLVSYLHCEPILSQDTHINESIPLQEENNIEVVTVKKFLTRNTAVVNDVFDEIQTE